MYIVSVVWVMWATEHTQHRNLSTVNMGAQCRTHACNRCQGRRLVHEMAFHLRAGEPVTTKWQQGRSNPERQRPHWYVYCMNGVGQLNQIAYREQELMCAWVLNVAHRRWLRWLGRKTTGHSFFTWNYPQFFTRNSPQYGRCPLRNNDTCLSMV